MLTSSNDDCANHGRCHIRTRTGRIHGTSAHWDWAHCCHVCIQTGPALATSGTGAHHCHICAGTGACPCHICAGIGLTGAKIEAFGCCYVEVMKPDDSSDVRARRSGVLTVCRGPTRCDIRSLPCLLPGCKTDHGQVPEGHCRPMRDGGTDDCADCGLDRERSEYGRSDEQLAGCAHSRARGTAVPRAAGQAAPTQSEYPLGVDWPTPPTLQAWSRCASPSCCHVQLGWQSAVVAFPPALMARSRCRCGRAITVVTVQMCPRSSITFRCHLQRRNPAVPSAVARHRPASVSPIGRFAVTLLRCG